MARKRKRHGPEESLEGGNRFAAKSSSEGLVQKSLLSQYYPKILTLREYLLSKLPPSSKVRRRKIAAFTCCEQFTRSDEAELDDISLSRYLDQTLVGVGERFETFKDERWKQWTSFSQRPNNSESTIRSGGDGECSQSEIIDFTIWQLFKQNSRTGTRLQHLLCQGFRRDVNFNASNRDEILISAIPGVVSTYPNHHVTMLKNSPWPQILAIMGKEGQKIMIDLVLDCGIYIAIECGHGNYFQLSGKPLGDLEILPEGAPKLSQQKVALNCTRPPTVSGDQARTLKERRTPSRILFVRNRIFYARPVLNTKGEIRYGLRHIHVLNQYSYGVQGRHIKADELGGLLIEDDKKAQLIDRNYQSSVHVMMYIFPSEFGLHNVFTSQVDPRETVQSLKDYTLREEEIANAYGGSTNIKVPRRLRGKAMELVRKLQISHSRCSYDELLKTYCPSTGSHLPTSVMATQQMTCDDSTGFETQIHAQVSGELPDSRTDFETMKTSTSWKPTLMDYATPTANVSAFCRSVVSVLIPNDFWGEGNTQTHNKGLFLRSVDRFITLRRFELLSLHDVIQGMKTHDIAWLSSQTIAGNRMSQSDSRKRLDLFLEFVYYVFDSILIPLIRSHFFVTESNVHRYRIFYFRQDVWRSLCEPQLTSLKQVMLEEMNNEDAQKILNSRTLGFSHLRLLPKETGVRPIMNLRRRPLKKGYKNVLGSSINSLLTPVYNMFIYEKNVNPSRMGSTIFSVGDLYHRIKHFNTVVERSENPLFFVKVDVQSAFDTIPQTAVLRLMGTLPSESEYRISKHAEIKPGEGHRLDVDGQGKSKPIRKWISLATSPGDFQSFEGKLETNLAVGKKSTVFVENIVSQFRDKNDLLDMLTEHVQHNMVKIGKKFYRQKKGIPQGSVLSSILCNYFYADLEARNLGFLNAPGTLLLRFVDDFLLITTDCQRAKQFLQIMHNGIPEYGVTVNPAKTLVNFEVTINEMKVMRLVGSRDFPYCGNFIDTKTLNITKDRERKKDMAIADTLTVGYSKTPGKTFHHKVLNTFKLQAHAIFLDTSFNSFTTVFSNIYDSFTEAAVKMWRYAKCLPLQKQPGPRVVIRTIEDLIELAFVLMQSKKNNPKGEGYRCAVKHTQVEWLCLQAFHSVLSRKQSKYRDVLTWLEARIQRLRDKKGKECVRVMDVLDSRATICTGKRSE